MQARYIQICVFVAVALTIVATLRFNERPSVSRRATASPTKWASAPSPTSAKIVYETKPAYEPSLIEQVESLVATHDPAKAFAAYVLLTDCIQFNQYHDRMIFDLAEVREKRNNVPFRGMTDIEKRHDSKLCSGMTERMRRSRIDYLAIAAAAGISGAIVQMAHEGPFGDRSALVTRPDDPLVREWRTRVLDQLTATAERGDLVSLNSLWTVELTGDALITKDPVLAYRYAAAIGLIEREVNGPQAVLSTMYEPDGPFMLSIEGLSDDQRSTELVAAQRIADNARERRLHETKKLQAIH